MAIFCLSLGSKINLSDEWIRFPFYHHVFDDERKDFVRHLKYMRNYGDFISLDQAVEIFEGNGRIGGRYFCVTFDDGYKNIVQNALPILLEHRCPATIFVPTECIDKAPQESEVEFLDWDDCRFLLKHCVTIGSHTCSHASLRQLSTEHVRSELALSKQKIEREIGVACLHFSPPWGKPEVDYDQDSVVKIAQEVGYRSILTTSRGPNRRGTNPFWIRRDSMVAGWRDYQLRYFFSSQG